MIADCIADCIFRFEETKEATRAAVAPWRSVSPCTNKSSFKPSAHSVMRRGAFFQVLTVEKNFRSDLHNNPV